MNQSGDTFWLDKWEGQGRGGVFTRCNLPICVKEINKRGGRVVGIKLDLDGGWNLELVIEEPDTKELPKPTDSVDEAKK